MKKKKLKELIRFMELITDGVFINSEDAQISDVIFRTLEEV